jgi:plasmid stabilization system protein ParE
MGDAECDQVTILFSPRAKRDIERCARWWLQNRELAPGLFAKELADALTLIRTAPALSSRYSAMNGREHRRVLMQKTEYHVYFRVVSENTIRIVSVWSAVRKRGPKL